MSTAPSSPEDWLRSNCTANTDTSGWTASSILSLRRDDGGGSGFAGRRKQNQAQPGPDIGSQEGWNQCQQRAIIMAPEHGMQRDPDTDCDRPLPGVCGADGGQDQA